MKVDEIKIGDTKYPKLLKEIGNPPKKLYFLGDISLLNTRCLAIVGSRKTTEYGRLISKKIGETLAERGMTIVSGLAVGIDTCAHKGALAVEGKTIAVLGCGIDVPYPSSNLKLKNEIGEKGLIVSEYPLNFKGTKYSFPMRNRIISGLCEAVVIGEAGIHSGALITANLACEQGRYIYSVPSNINNIYNLGGNLLIRDGATPLVVIDDLLDDLKLSIKNESEEKLNLGKDEKKVYFCIKEEGMISINNLCKKVKMQSNKVNGIITVLEIKKVIQRGSGKIFIAK